MSPPQWAYQVENFEPKPDDELICSVCHSVFCEPVACPCNHVFCKECISKWLKNNRNCPVCRGRVDRSALKNVVPIVKNIIMKLTMICHNCEQGCKEKFALENCMAHVKECQFEYVKCKNKPCKEKILRKDIEDHETTLCKHRHSKCKKCGSKILWNSSLDDHNCIRALLVRLKRKNKIIKKKDDIIKKLKNDLTALQERSQRSFSSPSPDSSISPDQILIDLESSGSSYDSSSFSDDSEESLLAFIPEIEELRRHRADSNDSQENGMYNFRRRSSRNSARSNSQDSSDGLRNRYEEETRNYENDILNTLQDISALNMTLRRMRSERDARISSAQNNGSSVEGSGVVVEFPSEEPTASEPVEDMEVFPPRPFKRRHSRLFSFSSNDNSESEEHLSVSSKRFECVPSRDSTGASTSHAADQSMHSEAGPSTTEPSNNSTASSNVSSNVRSRRNRSKRHNRERNPVFERTFSLLDLYCTDTDSDADWIPPTDSDSDSDAEWVPPNYSETSSISASSSDHELSSPGSREFNRFSGAFDNGCGSSSSDTSTSTSCSDCSPTSSDTSTSTSCSDCTRSSCSDSY